MSARMLYVHALTPIHAGAGAGTGIIDLPVIRETHTGWPFLPGSSLKGVLRAAAGKANAADDAKVLTAFGPPSSNAGEYGGALTFTDSHLLCFPVRSVKGGFAWVTCPYALRRWQRDAKFAGLANAPVLPTKWPAIEEPSVAATILVQDELNSTVAIAEGQNVYLEELDFALQNEAEARTVGTTIANAVFLDEAWRTVFLRHFGIVSDDIFSYLVTTATEVTARIRIEDETKTVATGALWWEEAVPAEAIFAGPLLAPASAKQRGGQDSNGAGNLSDADLFKVVSDISDSSTRLIQIGGNATVGRGIVELRLAGGQP